MQSPLQTDLLLLGYGFHKQVYRVSEFITDKSMDLLLIIRKFKLAAKVVFWAFKYKKQRWMTFVKQMTSEYKFC